MATITVKVNSVTWKSGSLAGAKEARISNAATTVEDNTDGALYGKQPGVSMKDRSIDIDFLYTDTLNGLTNGDKGILVVVLKEGKGGSNATLTYTNAVITNISRSLDYNGTGGTVSFEGYAVGAVDPLVIS